MLTPVLWGKVDDGITTAVEANPQDLIIPPPPEKIEEPKIETPPPVELKPEVKSQIRFTEPKIVDDSQITELTPDQDDLNEAVNIGTENIMGKDEPIPIEDPDATKATQPEMPVAVETDENDKIFLSVEQNPEFAGGMNALLKFLQKNLRYPTPAVNANVGGKVYMQFVVGQDGNISKVDVLKGIGFGCDEEAQRVVKLMPKWSPGRQSGKAVAVKFTLPINFQLSE